MAKSTGGGGRVSVASKSNMWWKMDSYEKIARPKKSAGEYASGINYPEITEGTEKQIKFAQDLRKEFLSSIQGKENAANIRWAVIKQTKKNEKLDKLDVSRLATDAWDRRTVHTINTNNAKVIIDHFKSLESQQKRISAIGRYENIINYPQKWEFDGKKWKQKS